MRGFSAAFRAEAVKLRRSPALRLALLLPFVYLAVEFLVFQRPLLAFQTLPAKLAEKTDLLQLKLLVGLWTGFFHPLFVALLPALLFRSEHRFKTWRHLHAQPTSRSAIFLAKATWTFLLLAVALTALGILLSLERHLLGWAHPPLALPLHAFQMAQILGWLWLASLPVLALTLWLSDRINSLAVPAVFGLMGLMLTLALTGQDLPQPWRRDLIPWVLPYAAAEQVIHSPDIRQQEAHLAAALFQPEPDILRLPSGKKIRTWQNVPDHILFPPSKPTPSWLLGTFSILATLTFLALGNWEAGRERV